MTSATTILIALFTQLIPARDANMQHPSISRTGIVYAIAARLDVDYNVLDASERVAYVNTTSRTLDTLILYCNKYMTIQHVTCGDDTLRYMVGDDVLVIPLSVPLVTSDSCTFVIAYRIDIPVHDGTFGYVPEHYEMTTWYPKMCVCDEEVCHGEGTYDRTFASYDVTLDLPGDYIVTATGTQIDPAESLFMETYSATGRKEPAVARRQAHFIAPRVSDFVWVCDPYFMVRRQQICGVDLTFLFRPFDVATWDSAMVIAASAVTRYGEWFGAFPYDRLALVQGICRGGDGYPQIMFVTSGMESMTHLFEAALAADIGKQWFGFVSTTDQGRQRWFIEGMAAYAAIRYMEDRYGKDQSMIRLKMFPALSLRYFHRAMYYFMHTNELERSMDTPEQEYDIPLAYTSSVSSKPALVFLSLEQSAGEPAFADIMRTFLARGVSGNACPRDFFEIYEERTGEIAEPLYSTFVHSTAYCDWRVKGVAGNTVVIEHAGGLPLAARMRIRTDMDTLYYTISPEPRTQTIILPEHAGRIKDVAIDPSESLLDPYYWNNYYPRRIRIRPVISFEMPTFSTYDVYWLPYPWYDTYDGVTGNFYWFGDRFADFDFIMGGHQILGGVTYGFKSKQAYINAGYQTPVIFKKGIRVRVAASGSHNKHGNNGSIGLVTALGVPLTSLAQTTIENRFVHDNVSSYNGLDSTDWSLGTTISLENELRYRHAGWDLAVGIALSHGSLGSDWDYIRTTCSVQRTLPLFLPCKARIFIGNVFGDAPEQERLFLSGDLRLNWFADLLFSQSGTLSPQEHIHVPGSGSMRGYQTFHLRSDQMYACNVEIPLLSVFHVFADVGYYDEFAFDAGVSIAISAETVSSLPLSGIGISANFPLYTYSDEPWSLRWSIGFSM